MPVTSFRKRTSARPPRRTDVSAQFRHLRRTGDPVVRDELVERFLPLARRLAHRYNTGPEPLEDLVQVAGLALVKAVDRYDAGRGVSFASFAVPTITGELKRHFRDTGWAVHVPRSLQEQALAVGQAMRAASEEQSSDPSVEELGRRTELAPSEVRAALGAGQARTAMSLDAPTRQGDEDEGMALGELVTGRTDPGYELVEDRQALRPALRRLGARDRRVLHLRFVEEKTQAQIAAVIGVSQMQVSRILRRIIATLRAAVQGSASAA